MLEVINLSRPDPVQMRKACEESGFFYLVGHGVPSDLEARLEAVTKKLFALSPEEKREIEMKRSGRAWRGWFPLGGELTSGQADLKEGVYFGAELPVSDRPLHGPNLFPYGVPEASAVVLEWMSELERVGQEVMQLIARSLGIPQTYFAKHLTGSPLCLFRMFHYPAPKTAEETAAWGVGEHTDYGLLTLLKQDDCGGLEVKTKAGWVSAPPMPKSFVCNLGDMLDRMTGGRYRSTPHRVRNTAGKSRYSWPFFFDPSFDAEVRALPGSLVRPIDVDAAERWDKASVHDVKGRYGDYLVEKVSKVFPQLRDNLAASSNA